MWKQGESKRLTILQLYLLIIMLLTLIVMPTRSVAQSNEETLLKDVISVSAGKTSSYAITEDGTAWAWGGEPGASVLGIGTTTPVYSPVKMLIDNVKMISSGWDHTLILKKDGTVWAVGNNHYGQLGIGETSYQELEPAEVKGLTDVVAVSAGSYLSLALKKDGTVWQWGWGDRVNGYVSTPKKVEGLPRITAVAAGYFTSTALGSGGEVWVWGTELWMSGIPDKIRKPTRLSGIGEVKAIAAQGNTAAAIQWDGTVWVWNNAKTYPEPEKLLQPVEAGITDAVSIVGGSNNFYTVIKSDGTLWEWNMHKLSDNQPYQVKPIQEAVAAANGYNHRLSLLKDGTVLAWGDNTYGQTGVGAIQSETLKTVLESLPSTITKPTPVGNAVSIVIDGEKVEPSVPPIIINNTTYVHVRIVEKLGATVKWESVSGEVTVNGKLIPAEVQPISLHYKTMVPLRFIAEASGSMVKWDNKTRSVIVTTKPVTAKQ